MDNYTVYEMVVLSSHTFRNRIKIYPPTVASVSEFFKNFYTFSKIEVKDVYMTFAIALLLTIHRYLFSYYISKPITRFLKLNPKNSAKFVESGCRLFFYSIFYAIEYYLLNFKYPSYRWDPVSHWKGWHVDLEVNNDIRYLYIIQSGFYFYAFYATLALDTWKKDSIPMLIHHVLANSLIIFSLAFRFHKIGLLVLYLHDSADICLESTKVVLALKDTFKSAFLELLSSIGFVCFAANWFWCRLVVYPQYALFSSMHISLIILPNGPFYYFFNLMLICLLVLNIWWFHFIVSLLIRVVTGRTNTVDDPREYDQHILSTNGNAGRADKVIGVKKME